jgi:hypothetical protein
MEVRRRGAAELGRRHAMQVGQRGRNLGDVRWLISFAAVRDRRQKWTVGLDEQPIERHGRGGRA